jgi:hypothetical protein
MPILKENKIYSLREYDSMTNLKNRRVNALFVPCNSLPQTEELAQKIEKGYIFPIIPNFGHFFHDLFFPLYVAWRSNKHPIVLIGGSVDVDIDDFIKAAIPKEYLFWYDSATDIHLSEIVFYIESRDLRFRTDYLTICREIANNVAVSLEIAPKERRENTIFTREGLARKNLKNAEHLIKEHNFNTITMNMSFKQSVEILLRTKNFVTMVGATVTLYIFLDGANVFEINPHRDNSWARMFGLNKMLKNHIVYVSLNTSKTDKAYQLEPKLDDHAVCDPQMITNIRQMLQS